MRCRIEPTNEKYSRADEKREAEFEINQVPVVLRRRDKSEKTFNNIDELLQWLNDR